MRIDHVVYGTGDLEAASRRLEAVLGIRAIPGGRHEGLGTHNRLLPLPDGTFIEVLGIADPGAAARSPIGAALAAAIAAGDGWLGWVIAVDDVDVVAGRLGTAVGAISREGMTARVTGIAESAREPHLPFFIERPAASRPPEGGAITGLELAGDAARLRHWLGGAELPVRVDEGDSAVRGVGVRGLGTLGSEQLAAGSGAAAPPG